MRLDQVLGGGPVYPVAQGRPDAVYEIFSTWQEAAFYGVKVLWVAPPTFSGRVLVRGVAADGTALRFEQRQRAELRIQWKGGASDAWVEPDGWREAGGYTWVPGPGCHQWQVDTESGSVVIRFQARLAA
jgi:hypothetical protein